MHAQRNIDMELHIQQSIHQDITLTEKIEKITIEVDERINAFLTLTYSGLDIDGDIKIHMHNNAHLKLFIKNETNAFNLKVEGKLLKNSDLQFAYCDLQDGDVDIRATFVLLEEGANILLRSACITNTHKHFQLSCIHESAYTISNMQHYAVVDENGDYSMEACGQIKKGAHDSISQQTTRVLTMSEQHTSQVVPLLLIDENNVKASHATTIGQPDENQLYYLQTRGLSREQALGLLSIGYLMPIVDVYEDAQQIATLKNEIEMKVGLHA